MYASRNGHKSVVQLLLDHHADVNATDEVSIACQVRSVIIFIF